MIHKISEDKAYTVSNFSTSIHNLIDGAKLLKKEGFTSINSGFLNLKPDLYKEVLDNMYKSRGKWFSIENRRYKKNKNNVLESFNSVFLKKIEYIFNNNFKNFLIISKNILGSEYSFRESEDYFVNIEKNINLIKRSDDKDNVIKYISNIIKNTVPIFDSLYVNIINLINSNISSFLNSFSNKKIDISKIDFNSKKVLIQVMEDLDKINKLTELLKTLSFTRIESNIFESNSNNSKETSNKKEDSKTPIGKNIKENNNLFSINLEPIKFIRDETSSNTYKYMYPKEYDKSISIAIESKNVDSPKDFIINLIKSRRLKIYNKDEKDISGSLLGLIDDYSGKLSASSEGDKVIFTIDNETNVSNNIGKIEFDTSPSKTIILANDNKNILNKYAINIYDLIGYSSNTFEVDRNNIIKKIKK